MRPGVEMFSSQQRETHIWNLKHVCIVENVTDSKLSYQQQLLKVILIALVRVCTITNTWGMGVSLLYNKIE